MKNPDIVLINPPFSREYSNLKYNLPPNLLALGSYLVSKGINVRIIDCTINRNYIEMIKEATVNSILVGFGVMTNQIPFVLEITTLIKKINPCAKFVWGGVHPTLFPEQTIRHKDVDFLIRGEGEEPLYRLYKSLKYHTPFDKIPGLVFKQQEGIHISPLSPLMDIEKLPSNNWSLLGDYAIGLYRNNHGPLPLSTSRGCPHRCTFCINVCTGNKWRGISAKKVLDEISFVYHTLKIKKIKFRDECFFVNKSRTKAILNGLIEKGLNVSWQANCRIDYFTKGLIDKELLELMKKTNCEEVGFGIESGSKRIIKMIKKDINLDDVFIVAKTLKQYGIRGNYSFMIGMPYETMSEMIETIRFIKKLKKIDPSMVIIGPQPYRPYPGGEMYSDALKLGLFEPKSLDEWRNLYSKMDISISSKSFPWIKDNSFVDYISVYTRFAMNSWANIRHENTLKGPRLFVYAFAMWCKIRWALGLYGHLFEIRLLEAYSEWIKKM